MRHIKLSTVSFWLIGLSVLIQFFCVPIYSRPMTADELLYRNVVYSVCGVMFVLGLAAFAWAFREF